MQDDSKYLHLEPTQKPCISSQKTCRASLRRIQDVDDKLASISRRRHWFISYKIVGHRGDERSWPCKGFPLCFGK